MTVPASWYNILPDLGLEVPPDIPVAGMGASGAVRVPPALIRQELSKSRDVPIPAEVARRYQQWRPTPLRRAEVFESLLRTHCRIYYKYEGGNISGSHKLNTAVAQAYYYWRAGARRLVVGTGAGQWGTAVAAACAMFGLSCTVFMVRSSYLAKPYRRTIMEMLGATVIPSPSPHTTAGRRGGGPDSQGTLSVALAEALDAAEEPGTFFCTGSGETYALLHQTVVGLETRQQLQDLGEVADTVVGSLGAGSNLGGIALPFLGEALRGERPPVRCVSVEPAACPKLTRGRYAYDHTDSSGRTPLQKMYTLGSTFIPPDVHAGGLRYHGTAKLISLLYASGYITAQAYRQREVFATAIDFAKTEGVLPAPESAHAIHGAAVEARQADAAGVPRTIVVVVSGHGLLDMAAYESYLDGSMVDAVAADETIARALAALPDATLLPASGQRPLASGM